jgi:DNA-binding MarR family transcriptional regulator
VRRPISCVRSWAERGASSSSWTAASSRSSSRRWTLNAILARQLAGTGLTEPQWITLTLTAAGNGSIDRSQLAGRLVGALKVSEADAQARITELATAHLLRAPGGEGSLVRLTDAGQQLFDGIRAAIAQITRRLWGDLPAEDLVTAGRVLSIVTARANAELAAP